MEATVAPSVAAGRADLVPLGHQLMLNLAALTAGIDRPAGTAAETGRLYAYMMRFIEGATLAHSTRDKDAQRAVIAQALVDWDAEFLAPSMARRRALGPDAPPRDVLACLCATGTSSAGPGALRREVALLPPRGRAHQRRRSCVRRPRLGWIDCHPADADRRGRPVFVQRCVHGPVAQPVEPDRPQACAGARARSGVTIPVRPPSSTCSP